MFLERNLEVILRRNFSIAFWYKFAIFVNPGSGPEENIERVTAGWSELICKSRKGKWGETFLGEFARHDKLFKLNFNK